LRCAIGHLPSGMGGGSVKVAVDTFTQRKAFFFQNLTQRNLLQKMLENH